MKRTKGLWLFALVVAGCGASDDEGGGDAEATGSTGATGGPSTAVMTEASGVDDASATASAGDTADSDGSVTSDDTTASSDTGDDTTDTGAEPIDLCTGLVVGDQADHPQTALSAPDVGGSVIDPEFGSTIVRIAQGGVPMYSTVSAWNADETRMVLYHPGSGHRLYDGTTYEPLEALPIAPNDLELVYWDTDDPDVLYFPDSSTLYQYSLASGSATPVHAFSSCGGSVDAGGDPFFASFDTTRFGFKCGSLHFIYDREQDQILGMSDSGFDLAPQVAPSGDRAYWQGLVVAPDLSTELDLMLDNPYDHASMGWDSEGRDTFLQVAFDGAAVGSLVAYDMQTGTSQVVVGPQTGYPYPPGGTHVSGLAYANPGWAVISVVGDGGGSTLLHGEIVVANWESGDVCRAAHHRSTGSDYFAEPHGVPSPTGTRILFGSDWAGSPDGYVLELPAFAP